MAAHISTDGDWQCKHCSLKFDTQGGTLYVPAGCSGIQGQRHEQQQQDQGRKRAKSEAEVVLDGFDEPSQYKIRALFVDRDELKQSQDELKQALARLEKASEYKSQVEQERCVYYRAAVDLFKRGAVEMLLHQFLCLHPSPPEQKWFQCGSQKLDKNFTVLLHHWLECTNHKTCPNVVTQFKANMLTIASTKEQVESELKNLYATLSQPGTTHYVSGDYPVRFQMFPNSATTLAMVTLLQHHQVPFILIPSLPASSSSSSIDEAKEQNPK